MKTELTQVSTFNLTPAVLEGLGLQTADLAEIEQVAQRIQAANPASVSEFGRDVAEHTSSYADSLLDQVRNSDLDEAGAKLTQVVSIARGLNLGPLSDKRSRLPIIGPILDKMRLKSANIMGKFDTTREQIESLVAEVQTTQGSIAARNLSLGEMFDAVRQEHRMLGVHIAAGKVRLATLKAEADELRGNIGNNPGRVQELSDIDSMVSNLDKRIGDLMALQHSAMLSLPTIRMIQANNQMLVDKFHTIREITVPAWKRQFMLAISLNEQRNAVELATTIDDTTNELLRRNADLLHRNSVDTAKANQRLVIDVETLQYIQTSFIKNIEEVVRIQNEGIQHRKTAEKQIEGMRLNLRNKVARQPEIKQVQGAV